MIVCVDGEGIGEFLWLMLSFLGSSKHVTCGLATTLNMLRLSCSMGVTFGLSFMLCWFWLFVVVLVNASASVLCVGVVLLFVEIWMNVGASGIDACADLAVSFGFIWFHLVRCGPLWVACVSFSF